MAGCGLDSTVLAVGIDARSGMTLDAAERAPVSVLLAAEAALEIRDRLDEAETIRRAHDRAMQEARRGFRR
jgi:hypothetical protein